MPFKLFILCLFQGLLFCHSCFAAATANLPLTRASAAQKFMVTLIPPNAPILVNQMHQWQLRLTNPEGRAIKNASFRVEGGMPQHNHGLPTKPQVTQESAYGTYLLEGMKFSMPGWWEITLHIKSENQQDVAKFQILIDLPAAPHPAQPETSKHAGSAQ